MTDAAAPLEDNLTVDEIVSPSDVGALQNGIREASASQIGNYGESSLYYEASTMVPLNAFSAVSCGCFFS